jgi:penicillin-binding protein 2
MSRLWFVCFVVMLAACAPTQSGQGDPTNPPMPTRVPSATPEYNNIDNAEAVALTFLEFWTQRDYESMYDLLSPASQQAYSFDSFRTIYQTSHDEMRLESLTFTPVARARQSNRVAALVYDVTFTSELVGEFSDQGRELQLVLDSALAAWGVAWSPGAIFAEMDGGASIRMETAQPRRAAIFDRNGRVLADMNGQVASLQVIKAEIPDMPACITTMSAALSVEPDEIQARLDNNAPDWLAEIGILEENAFFAYRDQLETNCTAQFVGRDTRRYIYGDLFAHIIGTVGYPLPAAIPELERLGFRQDSIVGVSGIEASWDATLRGQPGGRLTIVNPNGETLRVLAERGTEPAHNVHLTLDVDLQRATLNRIREEYATYAEGWGSTSDGAAAVVLNVQTGEVLAMVSYPSFNPNAFTPFPITGRAEAETIVRSVEADPREPQLNRAAQGRYPTGSVMKTFTALAALDSGVYDFDDRYNSTGVWNRDIPRRDWLRGGHGLLDLAQALTHSCNTCFYEAGYRMNEVDPYLLPEYANEMGFGVATGLEDIPTSAGLIGTPDTKNFYHPEPWTFSDAVDMAIGQGMVEVSPLQLAVGYGLVANGGMHYRPQIIMQTELLDEVSYTMEPELMDELDVSGEILDFLQAGLCDVTTRSFGTAEFIFRNSDALMDQYGVCGKTGTAQNTPNPLPHAWFAAWAPVAEPEIVVVVMVENAGDGSAVAAPIARDILDFYFFGDDNSS